MSKEDAKSYAQLEAEIDRLKIVIKSRNDLLNKINFWLVDEITTSQKIENRLDNGEDWENVCDNPEAFHYRKECAEGLHEQIEKWEKGEEDKEEDEED